MRLEVVETAEDAARVAARLLAEAARAGSHIALAGGSTPRRAYELTAVLEPDWSAATVWFGDERCVPPDDERSNFRLAREALLERLEREPEVRRVETELGCAEAARRYDEALAGVTLDLALLGLGPDGHTASLFPGSPALDERERYAVGARPGRAPLVDRVTMTIPTLANALRVVFLATGGDKADAAARAFSGPPSRDTPASLVRSTAGETYAILDREAAARLDTRRPGEL